MQFEFYILRFLVLNFMLEMFYAWSLDDVTKTTSVILGILEDIELMVRKGEIEL